MHVLYKDHFGSDLMVVNAARVSFAKESAYEYQRIDIKDYDLANARKLSLFGWHMQDAQATTLTLRKLKDADANLIQYLARGMSATEWREAIFNLVSYDETTEFDVIEDAVTELIDMAQHWAPFAHPVIQLRVSAPLPIRTQHFKHKIGFVESEESRRYISSTPVLYVPSNFRSAPENRKQGSGPTHDLSDYWLNLYKAVSKEAINHYVAMIADGVCPEQARFILPQGVEVTWIWTGTLAAYARYYNQRTDSHTQIETATIAKAIGDIIAPLYPHSWAALTRQEPVFYNEADFD